MQSFTISVLAAHYLRRKFKEQAGTVRSRLRRTWVDSNTKSLEWDFYMCEGLSEYLAMLRGSGAPQVVATFTDYQVDYIKRHIPRVWARMTEPEENWI